MPCQSRCSFCRSCLSWACCFRTTCKVVLFSTYLDLALQTEAFSKRQHCILFQKRRVSEWRVKVRGRFTRPRLSGEFQSANESEEPSDKKERSFGNPQNFLLHQTVGNITIDESICTKGSVARRKSQKSRAAPTISQHLTRARNCRMPVHLYSSLNLRTKWLIPKGDFAPQHRAHIPL